MNVDCIRTVFLRCSAAFLSAAAVCTISVAQETDPDTIGVNSVQACMTLFGAKSLLTQKDAGASYAVQVGVVYMDGSGLLLRYTQGTPTAELRRIRPGTGEVDVETVDASGIAFRSLVGKLIGVAPTEPVQIDEAIAIQHASDANAWLFEYIDPIGGRISQVTVELSKELRKRDHSKLKAAFRDVMGCIGAIDPATGERGNR